MLVKEYFPVSVVVPTILEIYQNLLGVTFQEIKGSTWHPGMYHPLTTQVKRVLTSIAEVQQFAVWDKDAKDESGFIGYCYLDLFPRGRFHYDITPPILLNWPDPRIQILACRRVATPQRLHEGRWLSLLPPRRHGRQPC
jgi:hypothetical protein